MGLLKRILGGLVPKAAEGEYRPGPYALDEGWLAAGSPWNFWQLGRNVEPYGSASAMVEACVSAYAQTVAMCPGDHWRTLDTGGRERVTASALTRILRRPNDYQSISDFLLNLVRDLYEDGNGYAVALRNDRNEIAELHRTPARTTLPRVAEGGEVFYEMSGNEILDRRFGHLVVPARDVLHVRLHTPRHPLKGVSPIVAAALDLAAAGALTRQQAAYFENQAKPSFILETDEKWTAEQARETRRMWNEQTQGANAGGTPIVGWGLKAKPIGGTAEDAQLAETLKLTDQHVALAFRMPMQVLGIAGNATMGSTEALMGLWLASGLGFALNHVEEAMGNLFRLKGQPEEYVEFNTRVLLRSSFKERIEGLARGVQSGIYAPNEARNLEDMPDAEGGDEPLVQQQMVSLKYSSSQKPPSAVPALPAPEPEPEPDEDASDERSTAEAILRRIDDHAGGRLH